MKTNTRTLDKFSQRSQFYYVHAGSSQFVLNQLALIPLSPDPFCPFSTGPCFIGPLEFCPLVSSSCFISDSCYFVLDPFGPHPFRPWPNSPLISSSSWHFVFHFFRTLLFSSFSKLPFTTLSPTQIVLYRLGLKSFSPSTLRPVTTLSSSTFSSKQRWTLLTAHNWQKWKRVFLTYPRHEIYRDEAVGLKSRKYTWKIMIYVSMWNLGQFRENLISCQ